MKKIYLLIATILLVSLLFIINCDNGNDNEVPVHANDYVFIGTVTDIGSDSSIPIGILVEDSNSNVFSVGLYPCNEDCCPEGNEILDEIQIGTRLLVKGELQKGYWIGIECGDEYVLLIDTENLSKKLDELNSEIIDMIGNAECSDTSSCHAIPFGDKPCGGPRSYLIYSDLNINPFILERMVAEYNTIDEIINQELGIISDCEMVSPPVVHCQNGRCVEKAE